MATEQETITAAPPPVTAAPAETTTTTPAGHDPDWDESPAPVATAPAAEKADSKPAEASDTREEPVRAETEPAAPADEFDGPLLEYAKMYGFGEEAARQFGSRANLETALAVHENLVRSRAQGKPVTAEQQQKAADAVNSNREPNYKLLEEQLGTEAVAEIKAMREQDRAELVKLREMNTQHEQRWTRAEEAMRAQAFAAERSYVKSAIDELPAEVRGLLKGDTDKAMERIIADARAIKDGLLAENPTAKIDDKVLVHRAFKREFAEDILKIEREKLAKKVAAVKGQETRPATHRAPPKKTGDPRDDAIAEVRAKKMAAGLSVETEDPQDDWGA